MIAGAGQLGSRYLQGLSKFDTPLEICVFDRSEDALRRAKERWLEVHQGQMHSVIYETSLKAIPEQVDVAIVATTANGRVTLLNHILEKSKVGHWIIEKVVAQSLEELEEVKKLLGSKSAWVNTPRYQWTLYKNLRSLYGEQAPLAASFEGIRGLASNAIHFIDLISRWNGTELTKVKTRALGPEWLPSKRAGFHEIEGEIQASFSDGSTLALTSYKQGSASNGYMRIGTDDWQLNEVGGIARCKDGRVVQGATEYQSELTAPTIKLIMAGRQCGLPTIMASLAQHEVFIGAMLAHWNQHMPTKTRKLPIT